MISVHEENRWPFTGRLSDTAGGSAFNLPVPAGFNDTEFSAALHGLILPRLAAFRPDAPEPLKIAARAQHIERWTVPRTSYPEGEKKVRMIL